MKDRPYAQQALPEDFRLFRQVDLIKEPRLLLSLSLASLGLFIAFWVGLGWLLQALRPDFADSGVGFSLTVTSTGEIIIPLMVFFGVIIVMLVLHEAIHGICFWLFTGGRVKFAFKGAYAYAAAPGWYIDKLPYMVISLAPLVLITAVGLGGLVLVPLKWVTPLILLIAMNASGAVGDIYVFFYLLCLPGGVLVQDYGERMAIYTRDGETAAI